MSTPTNDESPATWTPEDHEIPDWHCAHHGEMGSGPFACGDPEHR